MSLQPSTEIDVQLVGLLLKAKNVLLADKTAPAKKSITAKEIMDELCRLKEKEAQVLKIVIDLTQIQENRKRMYQLPFMEEEMVQYGNDTKKIPASSSQRVMEHNLIAQLLAITEEKFHGQVNLFIPVPEFRQVPDRGIGTRPSAAETAFTNLANKDVSLNLEFDTGEAKAWIILNPRQHEPFQSMFIPYKIPLDAVVSITVAPPNSVLTPSINSRTLQVIK